MTTGRCVTCRRPTIALDGPMNAKRRLSSLGYARIGYVIEADKGRALDHPLLKCGPCIFDRHLLAA